MLLDQPLAPATHRVHGRKRRIANIYQETLPRPSLRDIYRVCQQYKQVFGHYPNLAAPRRFTEKMQWRKLFDLDPIYSVFCDKLASREFIASRLDAAYLPELLWVGDRFDEIPFEALGAPYVLKCNRSSGYSVIVTDPRALDKENARQTLQQPMSYDHGRIMSEPGYSAIRPRLLVERLLLQSDGTPPLEHKLFVFDGRVRMIHTVVVLPDRRRFDATYDENWNYQGWYALNQLHDRKLPRPARLDQILEIAQRLAAGLDHLRVDLYVGDGGIKVGELTPYNMSGLVRFVPDDFDFILGSHWRISNRLPRALASRFNHHYNRRFMQL